MSIEKKLTTIAENVPKVYQAGEQSQQGIIDSLNNELEQITDRFNVHANEVVNTQSILLELWGDDSFFNSRSLHVFITKLRHKLSKDERIRIVNVRGIGYKLVVQE